MHSREPHTIEFRFQKRELSELIFKAIHDVDVDIEGQPVSLLGSIQDITEQKKSARQLEKFSLAVEQSSASIVITDINGTIEYVNDKFVSVSGYSREELIGANNSILKSGEHDLEFYENLWHTLMFGQEWTGEFCTAKNGDLYWESTAISSIVDEWASWSTFSGERGHHRPKEKPSHHDEAQQGPADGQIDRRKNSRRTSSSLCLDSSHRGCARRVLV